MVGSVAGLEFSRATRSGDRLPCILATSLRKRFRSHCTLESRSRSCSLRRATQRLPLLNAGSTSTDPTVCSWKGGTNPWSDAIKKFPFKYEGVPVCGDFCVEGVVGCTLSFACDYNPEANVDGDCTFPIEYYGCDNECINDADGDGVCDELEVVGCQDPTAFNYNESATDPAECEEVVFGCTDPTMFNYNELANTENNSCIPFIYGCTDP